MRAVLIFLKSFQKGQKRFGETIAALVNSALLTFVYFLGVGSTHLVSKIIGKKSFLEKSFKTDKKTYWTELNLSTQKKEAYFSQY